MKHWHSLRVSSSLKLVPLTDPDPALVWTMSSPHRRQVSGHKQVLETVNPELQPQVAHPLLAPDSLLSSWGFAFLIYAEAEVMRGAPGAKLALSCGILLRASGSRPVPETPTRLQRVSLQPAGASTLLSSR